MPTQPNHRHVFSPDDIQVLRTALTQAVELLEREYGFRGKALASAKTIAAKAICQAAQQFTYDALQLAAIGFEGVRQCLVERRDNGDMAPANEFQQAA